MGSYQILNRANYVVSKGADLLCGPPIRSANPFECRIGPWLGEESVVYGDNPVDHSRDGEIAQCPFAPGLAHRFPFRPIGNQFSQARCKFSRRRGRNGSWPRQTPDAASPFWAARTIARWGARSRGPIREVPRFNRPPFAPEMVEWDRLSELMVTNDTGPMHVAAALGTPIVALLGPTEPRRTGPYGQLDHVRQSEPALRALPQSSLRLCQTVRVSPCHPPCRGLHAVQRRLAAPSPRLGRRNAAVMSPAKAGNHREAEPPDPLECRRSAPIVSSSFQARFKLV